MKRHSPNTLRVPYALAVHDEHETKRVLAVLNEHRTIQEKKPMSSKKDPQNTLVKNLQQWLIPDHQQIF